MTEIDTNYKIWISWDSENLEKNDNPSFLNLQSEVNKLNKKVRSFESEKNSLISIFWIFASVVTFLSIEVQILKSVCSIFSIISISLLLFSAILLFNLLLNYLISDWEQISSKEKALGLLCLFFAVTWIIFAFYWNNNEAICKDNNFLEYKMETENQIYELQKQISRLRKDTILTTPNWE